MFCWYGCISERPKRREVNDIKSRLAQTAGRCGLCLTPEQLDLFAIYYAKLAENNRQLNLTAITEPNEVIAKHFIDSLLVYDHDSFPDTARVCDVGCGAGFPGLPLKICYPGISLTLLDSVAKKLKFLEEVISLLGLDSVDVCRSRAEDAGRLPERRESYDIVLARAVAPLNVLCEYCLPLVKPGGLFVAMKARRAMDELAEAQAAIELLGGKIEQIKQPKLPDQDDVRVNVYLRKIRRTAVRFPRKAGLPKKKPLL